MKRIDTLRRLLVLFVMASIMVLKPGWAIAWETPLDFESIAFWLGTGPNRAAFVMDWNEGNEPVSLVWGFRWEGEASGEDMTKALAAADDRLFILLEHWDNFGGSRTLYGAGYDINENGFTYVPGTGGDLHFSNDDGHPEDPEDYYKEGWLHTGYWSYHLSSDKGVNWTYSSLGITARQLSDGDVDGWRFCPYGDTGGGYGKADPPRPPQNAQSPNGSSFATEIVETGGTFGTGSGPAYSHPDAVLGKPAVMVKDGAGKTSRVKMVEPAWILGPSGEPLITSVDDGAHITVTFDHNIIDDPNNPYGIDFIVYGNAFFVAAPESGLGGMFDDTTDMSRATLTGGAWCEKVKVSVSQDGSTWYTYEKGPYGDSLFPTQAHVWDTETKSWTDTEMAWTRPVDPHLTLENFKGRTVEEAMLMYRGSGGGTGFDLKPSGYSWIRYIRVDGWPGNTDGSEIDAFSDVAPLPYMPGDVFRDGLRELRDVSDGLNLAVESDGNIRDAHLATALETLRMLTGNE